MSRRSLTIIALWVAGLAATPCRWPGRTDPARPGAAKEPEKVVFPGMVPEGADLSAAVTACASPIQLEEFQPAPAGQAADRSSVAVTVSGSFQGLADFLACFAQSGGKWELGELKIRRGPPKFFDYRLEVILIAHHFVMVPGPDFPDRAAAEKWSRELPARVQKAVGLLGDIHVAAEPAIELRELALAPGQGSLSGRASSYEEISAWLEDLQSRGLVKHPRVEAIRRNKSRMVEKNQEFAIRFEW